MFQVVYRHLQFIMFKSNVFFLVLKSAPSSCFCQWCHSFFSFILTVIDFSFFVLVLNPSGHQVSLLVQCLSASALIPPPTQGPRTHISSFEAGGPFVRFYWSAVDVQYYISFRYQHSGSVFLQRIRHHKLLPDNFSDPLCYATSPCCLPISYIVVYIC